MPEEKNDLYEQYREYFTCRSAVVIPGGGLFVFIHEGFVSWLTKDGCPADPGLCLQKNRSGERIRDELVNLLATIATGGEINGL